MESKLQHIKIYNFTTQLNKSYDVIPLSYQLFGQPLYSAPIIVINHALTGNSNVSGNEGWWKTLVDENKAVDLHKYTILCFNVPGNGFDDFIIKDYQNFSVHDIASLFLKGIELLKIDNVFAIVGGSIGGSIGWEMIAQKPEITQHFIPIATDCQTSDWLNAQCMVQDFLLNSDEQPLEKARIHAMLCYRTPQSLIERFQKKSETEKNILQSQDWLHYHGMALNKRFTIEAYRLMNHLLKTIDVSKERMRSIETEFHLISVDTDLFFPASEIKKTFDFLKQNDKKVKYYEIQSIHGHDAFLMEYDQLNTILKPIFENDR